MKKLTLTFRYQVRPGERKLPKDVKVKLQTYPLIPVRFYTKTKKIPIFEALLDSGSDIVHINRGIMSFLNLPPGRKIKSSGMGGNYVSYETEVGLIVGRGGREVDFGIIKVIYPEEEKNVPILIGRIPVFEEFQVIFEEYKKKFQLIPKEEILEKEKRQSKTKRKF